MFHLMGKRCVEDTSRLSINAMKSASCGMRCLMSASARYLGRCLGLTERWRACDIAGIAEITESQVGSGATTALTTVRSACRGGTSYSLFFLQE